MLGLRHEIVKMYKNQKIRVVVRHIPLHLAVDRIKQGLKYITVFSCKDTKSRAKSTPLNFTVLRISIVLSFKFAFGEYGFHTAPHPSSHPLTVSQMFVQFILKLVNCPALPVEFEKLYFLAYFTFHLMDIHEFP